MTDHSILVPHRPPNEAPWLAELRSEIEAHPAVRHPLLARARAGELERADFAVFGCQHVALVGTFTRYLELLLLATDESAQKLWLAKVLIDEYGAGSDGRDHAELYADYLARLGVDADRRQHTPLARAVWEFVGSHLELCRTQPFLAGLGALGPGHEWAIPPMFKSLIAGLECAGIGESERLYFDLHTVQDQDHGAWMSAALEQLATDAATRDLVRRGALFSLERRARLWSAIDEAIGAARDGASPSALLGDQHELRCATNASLRGAAWPVELPRFA